MHVPKPRRWLPATILMALAIPLGPLEVSANEAALTLDEAERIVLSESPALSEADRRSDAMATLPDQLGSLPDPMLSLNVMNLPVDTFSNTQEAMTQTQVGVSQMIPFPGKLSLKAEGAGHMAEATEEDAGELRLRLLRDTRIRWWNIAYLDKALGIVARNEDLMRDLVRIAETKYATGKGLQQDVLLAQMELSRLLEQRVRLRAARLEEAAALNALLGRGSTDVVLPDIRSGTEGYTTPDVVALKRYADAHRPMLRAMQHRLEAARSNTALAERDFYPDFKLAAAYGFRQGSNAAGVARPDLASVMLGVTVPLYGESKQGRAVDQRAAEQASAGFALRDAGNRVHAEIESAASRMTAAYDQVQLFEQGILPQARQTTASMQAGYQVNKVDFLNLVRARLSEFNMDMQYWKQVTSLHQAQATLAAAAGMQTLIEVNDHE